MSLIKSIVILAVIIFIVAAAGIYSGFYNVAATAPHFGITEWVLETTMERSVEARAKKIEVPDLSDQTTIAKGARSYGEMCASCHGAPGKSPSYIAEGLYPKPPDFGKNFANPEPAELFWITKNGIKDTGMPAFGPTHEDKDLWEVVAFMNMLPDMSEDGYKKLKSKAKTMGGHDGHDHDHGHGGHDEKEEDNHHSEEKRKSDNQDEDVHIHKDGKKHVH